MRYVPLVMVFDSLPGHTERLNPYKYGQEGVIHVVGDSIAILPMDKPQLTNESMQSPTFFVLVSKEAPRGLLTGIYLSLRLMPKEEYLGLTMDQFYGFLNKNVCRKLEMLNSTNSGLLGNYKADLEQKRKKEKKILEEFSKHLSSVHYSPNRLTSTCAGE